MKKVMIIDDELNIIDILESFLQRSGKIEVTTNSNPESALEDIRNNDYHLILSDIMMPTLNGLEILEQIKQIKPTIKVILMTAYSTENTREISEKFNCDGYIEKPFKNLKAVENRLFTALSI